MSNSTNYTGIVDFIVQVTNRPFDESLINYINLALVDAQQYLNNKLNVFGQLNYVEQPIIPTPDFSQSGILAKPINWRNTINLAVGVGENFKNFKNLKLRTYEFCRVYWPDDSIKGEPEYYCDYVGSLNWLIVPIPDLQYPVQCGYIATLSNLSPEAQTNWLTLNAPQIIKYVTLYFVQIYLKNIEESMATKALADELINDYNKINTVIKTDRYYAANKV